MSLETKYDFRKVEENRYETWVNAGYFKAGRVEGAPFTIVIPPPNVTGKLHLGHAWDNTLQDMVIRRKRMQGYDTLYLPGMDHAGIATQAKVDERLKKMGISRYDIGREAFLEQAWAWKEEYATHIHEQWKALGISVDYSKERFTLDDQLNQAVNHVFVSLYNKGLIYRGNRIINWDVEAKTALSNIEVEHVDRRAKLYYFRYPIVGQDQYLVIATTRPETMFADQALMVHPNDKRYKKYHHVKVYIPGTKKEIPIITDDYVDMTFGTGVVKVTPAHDPNDFVVGQRHHLNMPLCMNEDGTMNELAGVYHGMERFECRQALINDLEKIGLVEKIEDYDTSIGYSERTGVVVEPRLSLQWFIKMDTLSKQALEKSAVKWIPERFEKIFVNWMTDTQDWCISRQLWWGHQIPAWYKEDQVIVSDKCPGDGWTQDEDVLDTWFSSALWPFSTLGWPNITKDFKKYYPNQLMVTGYDIIFFWVARMIFQGIEFTNQSPFEEVLIHGLIRAKDGKKMSKSLGNGVDPMDVIESYGVDALRYFLTTNSAPGADLRYDEEKVESSWNFINKLWNIARFVSMNIEHKAYDISKIEALPSQWILSRLTSVIKDVDMYFDKYEFGEAARILYNFIWDDFASWYVELSKILLQDQALRMQTQGVLLEVLKAILKMMHPFIPFVTDKLYQEVSLEASIMVSSWPTSTYEHKEAVSIFNEFKEIITKVRNTRNEYNVPSKPLDIQLVIENQTLYKALLKEKVSLIKFLGAEHLTMNHTYQDKEEAVLLVTESVQIYISKAGLIDLEKEIELLKKQKETLEIELARSKQILSNPKFVEKAPKDKVEIEKQKQASYEKQYEAIVEKLNSYVS